MKCLVSGLKHRKAVMSPEEPVCSRSSSSKVAESLHLGVWVIHGSELPQKPAAAIRWKLNLCCGSLWYLGIKVFLEPNLSSTDAKRKGQKAQVTFLLLTCKEILLSHSMSFTYISLDRRTGPPHLYGRLRNVISWHMLHLIKSDFVSEGKAKESYLAGNCVPQSVAFVTRHSDGVETSSGVEVRLVPVCKSRLLNFRNFVSSRLDTVIIENEII